MVDLSNLRKACAEREAQMNHEEREELNRTHGELLGKVHERMFAPLRAMEPVLRLDEVQRRLRELVNPLGVDSSAVRMAQDLVDGPSAKLAWDQAESPVAKLAREFADSPAALARDLVEGPMAKVLRRMGEGTPKFPAIELPRVGFSSPELERECLKPIPLPPNHQAQLVEEVVELRGDVAELQKEVREVRESARRDAHRGRRQVIHRDKREARFRLSHVILTAIVTTIVTVPLTLWLTKLLGG